MTEKEKMISGQIYDCLDQEIVTARLRAHDICHELSLCAPSNVDKINSLLRELIPHVGNEIFITPPFFCDYGWNIHIGDHFYCNTGCVILDAAPVNIGNHVLLGPNVQIYTATHALDPNDRANLVQWSLPITIGDRVWIGGGALVCPGVTIGNGCVIGAGSVVTHDLPAGWVCVGVPCHKIKKCENKT